MRGTVAFILGTILSFGPAFAEECSLSRDVKIIADSCVAAGKNDIGHETFRCGPLKVIAPDGFLLVPSYTALIKDVGAGDDTSSRQPNRVMPTEEEEPDFILRNFLKEASASVSCKTSGSAGSNCRISAVLQTMAIKKECLSSGTFFKL